MAIDVAEAAAAKQRYAGRLTRDLVEERLGMSLSAGPAGEPSPSLLRSSASEAAAGGLEKRFSGGQALGVGASPGDESLDLSLSQSLHRSAPPLGGDGRLGSIAASGSAGGPLEVLDLSQCRLRDLGGVFAAPEFQTLRDLNLDGNLIADLRQLADLPVLHTLRANNNRLPDAPLAGSDDDDVPVPDGNRRSGGFSLKPSGSAGGLSAAGDDAACRRGSAFPALEVLELGANVISSLPSLQLWRFRSLRVLRLEENDISRLEGLEALSGLVELALDRNRIKAFEPHSFSGLARLPNPSMLF